MIKWFRKKKDNGLTEEHQSEKDGLFSRLRVGLSKTREQLSGGLDRLFRHRTVIDDDLFEELEELLITCDVGVESTLELIDKLKERVKKEKIEDPSGLYDILRKLITDILDIQVEPLDITKHKPFVIMVVGVNGVGKTTSIAKLANLFKQEGFRPMLVAADTFRAAAIDQLVRWAERIDVPVVKQKPGADPSAVVYDALESAIARNMDVVIVDTAGRMHTKTNLMEELKKMNRVISRKISTAPHETLLVLDATTGQNAVSQVKMFKEHIGITGIILTKMDGTAKGGIIIGICHEFMIPVRFIGIGERMDDLKPFDPSEFTQALLATNDK